jgi:hypothetical protein
VAYTLFPFFFKFLHRRRYGVKGLKPIGMTVQCILQGEERGATLETRRLILASIHSQVETEEAFRPGRDVGDSVVAPSG